MHTVFQTDDVIVKGGIYEVEVGCTQELVKRDCVEFDFTLRVNGKLCNFTESFMLAEDCTAAPDNRWSWYLLLRILGSMGYRFVDNPDGFCKPYDQLFRDWTEASFEPVSKDRIYEEAM